jgi:hypothetical protein
MFSFEYNEEEDRERILMKCDSDACLVEISNPSKKVSYETVRYLKENDILHLKSYVITAYNTKTKEALDAMLSGVFIENIYLCTPQNSTQKEIYSEILKLKNVYEINIITYTPDKKIEFSDFALYPVFCDNKGKFAITIKYNDEFYSYVTADMLEESTRNHALKIMYGANTVIIGAKGENSNSDPFIYKISGDTRLIYNKKSGLTDEILKYYENRITADPSGKIDLYVE